jgi:hypothetical protein
MERITHMKPALYYSLARSPYSSSYRVVAVTTVKMRRWHGRIEEEGTQTNGQVEHLRGKFKTARDADAKRKQVEAIAKDYNDRAHALSKQMGELYDMRDAAIKKACE